jgi:hypothetical protein
MSVRLAEAADRMAVVRLLRDAHAAAGLPFGFSAAHALQLIDRHIADAARLALVFAPEGKPAGVLMASAQSHPFAPILYAAETVWWIAPKQRGRAAVTMLHEYEQWARQQGCAFCGMAALAGAPRAETLYRRLGYGPAETHFLKPLE